MVEVCSFPRKKATYNTFSSISLKKTLLSTCLLENEGEEDGRRKEKILIYT